MLGRVNTSGRDSHPIPSPNRAVGLKVFLCAVCCALTAVASAQILEGTILLPDTLGPLNGPYHLAWDSDSAHPRLYIGGEGDSGGVIVVDANNYKKLARIPTGPVSDLCFSPPHNKLYVAKKDRDSVAVVDCSSNRVIATIPVFGHRPALVYNRFNDRLYCGSGPLTVVDCATDSVIRTIAANGLAFAFDSTHNTLYCGSYGSLTVVDCNSDSVIASIPRVTAATNALLYNSTAKKVYATVRDTLYAVDTNGDSVVAALYFAGLYQTLACDPIQNWVYCGSTSGATYLRAIDCAGDTQVYRQMFAGSPTGLACDPEQDKVVWGHAWGAYICSGSTGSPLTFVPLDGESPELHYASGLDRVLSVPERHSLMTISCADESVVGGVPLVPKAVRLCLDTIQNKLYFITGVRAIGVVDCSRRVVTSYMWQCDNPEWMAFNPNGNKLYCSSVSDLSIVVFDGFADTAIKSINVGGRVRALVMYPGRNKLYAFVDRGTYWIDVIDGGTDSVMSSIALPGHYPTAQVLVPESDRLWSLHAEGFTIIDTKGDSVVADTSPQGWAGAMAACAAPMDREIYSVGDYRLSTVNMDSIAHIRTRARPIENGTQCLQHAASARKLYWASRNDIGTPDSVYVVDTRTDSVVSKFLGASSTSGMCADRTGNYVYSIGSTDDEFLTIDLRTDSVVNRMTIPRNPQGLVYNPLTYRIYLTPYWSGDGSIPVIFDSAGVGLYERRSGSIAPPRNQTVLRRGAPLRNTTAATIYDGMGRRAMVLRPGLNDIGRLAPGVYFVREEPRATSHSQQVIRKVVVAR
jgi:YVTN family beta-propeller protein